MHSLSIIVNLWPVTLTDHIVFTCQNILINPGSLYAGGVEPDSDRLGRTIISIQSTNG